MSEILVIGKVCVEMKLDVETPSFPGNVSECTEYEIRPGGRGAVASLCMRRIGASTAICSKVGRDGNAARVRNFLYENGVNTRALLTDSALKTSLNMTCREASSGMRREIVYRGAAERLSFGDLREIWDGTYDAVYLPMTLERELFTRACAFLSEQGIPIFADASDSSDPSLLREIGKCRVLYLSEKEAEEFSQGSCASPEGCLKCAMELERAVPFGFCVIRLEGRGLFVYDGRYFHIVSVCDLVKSPCGGYYDLLAPSLCASFTESGNILSSCEVGMICERLARSEGILLPGMADIRKYAEENNLDIHF